MLHTFLFTLIILVGAMLLLCVGILLRRKGGKFPSMHIHDSEAMRERGIGCVLEQDREARENRQQSIRNIN